MSHISAFKVVLLLFHLIYVLYSLVFILVRLWLSGTIPFVASSLGPTLFFLMLSFLQSIGRLIFEFLDFVLIVLLILNLLEIRCLLALKLFLFVVIFNNLRLLEQWILNVDNVFNCGTLYCGSWVIYGGPAFYGICLVRILIRLEHSMISLFLTFPYLFILVVIHRLPFDSFHLP